MRLQAAAAATLPGGGLLRAGGGGSSTSGGGGGTFSRGSSLGYANLGGAGDSSASLHGANLVAAAAALNGASLGRTLSFSVDDVVRAWRLAAGPGAPCWRCGAVAGLWGGAVLGLLSPLLA